MRVVVLNGSARKGGHTAAMVGAFRRGAEEAGHSVSVFNVANLDIHGCLGCEYCHTRGNGSCVQRDGMGPIYDAWNQMDTLVLASPIYYGSITGQLACALHRTYALGIPGRCTRTAMILSSGASHVYDAAEYIYHGFVQGYFHCRDLGVFEAAGAEATSRTMLDRLYRLGLSLA